MVDISPIVLLGWVFPQLGRIGPWKRFRENQNEIDALLYTEIARRRHAADLSRRTDVLSRLLQAGAKPMTRRSPMPSYEISWSR